MRLERLDTPEESEIRVDERLPVEAAIHLGTIDPHEVVVQMYHGQLDTKGNIVDGSTTELAYKSASDGVHLFDGSIGGHSSGKFGFALRVLPRHDSMATPFDTNLIYWA